MNLTRLISAVVLISIPAIAGEPATPAPSEPANLTLANFFTEGWNQPFRIYASPGGGEDVELIDDQTSLLTQEARIDYSSQQNDSSTTHLSKIN
jgi:hypothetical protein